MFCVTTMSSSPTDREELLAGFSDDELLTELWRRFGESWCSFSSGVRSRDECPICNEVCDLTRHHLVPVAQGAGLNREVKRRYVKLCTECHVLAHKVWGPGDDYQGPEEREIFVRDLRRERTRRAD